MSDARDPILDAFAAALEADEANPLQALDGLQLSEQVRSEVRKLLIAYIDAPAWLEHPLPLDSQFAADEDRLSVGTRVGAYEIIRELDRGGMAAVYLAKRTTDYADRVVLKIPHRSNLTDELRLRFAREREVLATLREHDDIVCLLDGGEAADGTPFAVMEFVEGDHLDVFCRKTGLPLRDRLELFLQVCDAVGHVHEHGLLHRDLKPSNVLVRPNRGVKLLDFGVAKLVSIEAEASNRRLTVSGAAPLTLDYASPEQVAGGTLSAASDVFSLGVILFEIVTGRRTERNRQQGGWPGKPSASVHSYEGAQIGTTQTAEQRQDEAGLIRHGLDEIVRCALKIELEGRYASVKELSDDIRRLLTGGKPRIATRLRRVGLARPRAAAILAGVLAVALGAVAWNYSAPPSARSGSSGALIRRPTVAVLGIGDFDGSTPVWVSSALQELLELQLAVGSEFRIVDRDTATSLATELQPAASNSDPAWPISSDELARIRAVTGVDYVFTGSFEASGRSDVLLRVAIRPTGRGATTSVEAKGSIEQLSPLAETVAAKIRESFLLGSLHAGEERAARAAFPRHPTAVRLYAQATGHLRTFEAPAAEKLLREAAAIEPEDPAIRSALSMALLQLADIDGARREAEAALERGSSLPQEQQLQLQATVHDLSGKPLMAVATYQALQTLFPDNVDYGLHVAQAQVQAGQLEAAEATLRALRSAFSTPRDDLRISLAEAVVTQDEVAQARIARSVAEKARKVGASALLAKALRLECGALVTSLDTAQMPQAVAACAEARQTADDANDIGAVGQAANNLGLAFGVLGRTKEAREMLSSAITISRRIGDRRNLPGQLSNLADLLSDAGDLQKAESLYREAGKLFTTIGNNTFASEVDGRLGLLLQQSGKLTEARGVFETSCRVLETAGDTNRAPSCRGNLGFVLWLLGDLAGAERELTKAVDDLGGISAEAAAAIFITFQGFVRYDEGRLNDAQASFQRAVKIARGGESDIARADLGLAFVLAAQAEWRRAESLLRKIEGVQKNIGEHVVAANTKATFARLLLENGESSKALEQAGQAAQEAARFSAWPTQSFALATMSEALSALGRRAEAAESADLAGRIAQRVDDYLPKIRVAQARALTQANASESLRILEGAMGTAKQVGNIPLQLELRLQIASLSLVDNPGITGQLQGLAKDATELGFLAIADRTRRLLKAPTTR